MGDGIVKMHIHRGLEDMPVTRRAALRDFLDAADAASPFQDPLLPAQDEACERWLVIAEQENGTVTGFAQCAGNYVLSRLAPSLKGIDVFRGPVADDSVSLAACLSAIEDLARRMGMVRINAGSQIDEARAGWYRDAWRKEGWRENRSEPAYGTLRLGLTRSPEDLLAGFHQGTRRQIRRAERLGLTVRRGMTHEDVRLFGAIHRARGRLKSFSALPDALLSPMAETLAAHPERCALFLSEKDGDALGGMVVFRAGTRVHYLYGGISGSEAARGMPVSYPLFWAAILWAKALGCEGFDFGGFSASGDPGVMRIKQGFGGTPVSYPRTFTRVLRPFANRAALCMASGKAGLAMLLRSTPRIPGQRPA